MGIQVFNYLPEMNEQKIYDIAVIGGGLAGLSVAVLLAKNGRSVVLFEKEKYPFHKVCGEYISMESWDFLQHNIGIPLSEMHLPKINKLEVSSPSGKILHAALDTGGFGISRYKLDNAMKELAEKKGVKVYDACKAEDIIYENERFTIKTSEGIFQSITCCGSWGKRSNIDIKWERPFTKKNSSRHDNYVGIKYHVTGDFPADTISLHNFKDGYCGLSKIEGDQFCLCYFTRASNLKKGGHSIEQAEEKILSENPILRKILLSAKKINDLPVTISQVSLSKKTAVENHVLLLGDAAGMISPLCGNGMSIAMHSAKLAAGEIELFLEKKITQERLEINYSRLRKKHFGRRINTGRFIQSLFGRKAVTDLFVGLMKRSKFLTKKMIGLTHGKRF